MDETKKKEPISVDDFFAKFDSKKTKRVKSTDKATTKRKKVTDTTNDDAKHEKPKKKKKVAATPEAPEDPELLSFLDEDPDLAAEAAAGDLDESSEEEEVGDDQVVGVSEFVATEDAGVAGAGDVEEDEDDGEERGLTSAKVSSLRTAFAREGGPTMSSLRDLLTTFTRHCDEICDNSDYIEADTYGLLDIVTQGLKSALWSVMKIRKATNSDPNISFSSLDKFPKISPLLQKFLKGCVRILNACPDVTIVYAILKEAVVLIKFVVCFEKVADTMFDACVKLWATHENSRIEMCSFLLMEKLLKLCNANYWLKKTRACYTRYVEAATGSNQRTIPKISFMQQTLLQLLTLDLNRTYKLAFESMKEIVNLSKSCIAKPEKAKLSELSSWKTVHVINLWCSLISNLKNVQMVEPLIYPLVELINTAISICPTARYYPFRFHMIDCLILLSRSTSRFIPILRHLLSIFSQTDFNTRPRHVVVRPFNLAHAIRFTDQDFEEKAFYDSVIDRVYKLFLEVINLHSHEIGSPELYLVPCVHLRKFTSKCSNQAYARKMKQLVDKMEENSQFICSRRENVEFTINDVDRINSWELNTKEAGTPISKFYAIHSSIEKKNMALAEKMTSEKDAEGDKNTREMREPSSKGRKSGSKSTKQHVKKKNKFARKRNVPNKPKGVKRKI